MKLTESEARAIVTSWKSNPFTIPELEHTQHCQERAIAHTDHLYPDTAFKCPISQYKREQDLRLRMTSAGIPSRYLEME
jgi:hypothetical protein